MTVVVRLFLGEHLRRPLTVALLVSIPLVFVWASTQVLGEFAAALGGTVAGDGAAALGAGWAAGFLAGAIGFFQVASSRDADRRLALAGLHPMRVACARLVTSGALAMLVSAAAFLALVLQIDLAHPYHVVLALLTYALLYLAVGAIIGGLLRDPLEGSVAIMLIFVLDVFSGPGMSDGDGVPTLSREAASLLLSAGAGATSTPADLVGAAATALVALAVAVLVFWRSTRLRS